MKRAFPLLIVIALAFGAAVVVLFLRAGKQTPTAQNSSHSNSPDSKNTPALENEVSALKENQPEPKSEKSDDTIAKDKLVEFQKAEPKYSKDPFDYGKSPDVPLATNVQTQALATALRKKSNPELFSPLAEPAQFDADAYRKNPKAYLDSPMPSRAQFPAQPEKNVRRISVAGQTRLRIKQSGSVLLRVQSEPNFPVTFTSYDLGKFSNELTTISVEANSEGIAETRFFGTPGTVDNVRILCASPVCSGQVSFTVFVEKE